MRKLLLLTTVAVITLLGVYFAIHLQSLISPELALLIAFALMGLLMLGAWIAASDI